MSWTRLESEIVSCARCPRLRRYGSEVARVKRRAFRAETYWGKPVPAFGDRAARVVIVGLAPAAHGAHRTGRMFTGDESGRWLYRALHRAGLSNRAESVDRGDGLELRGTLVTAACRCAPPGNKPTRVELDACAPYLDRELDLLSGTRVILTLGGIAWDAVLRRAVRVAPASVPRPRPRFGHLSETRLSVRSDAPPVVVVGSYHPSRQNTQTGRLTEAMLDAAVARAVEAAG